MFPEPIFIFGFSIHLFGLFAGLSIFLGYWVTYLELKRLNISTSFLPDLALAVLIPAFLGARLLFVFEHWPNYLSRPPDIFKFWEGGLALYGGLLGGLLGGWMFCRRRQFSFSRLSDPVALGLCIGLAVSRLGCLASGCCFGKPTTLPWGIVFRSPATLAQPLGTPLHPTQLYSFFIGMTIFAYLLTLRGRKRFDGQLLLSYFILESATRILLEFVRAHSYFITSLLAFLIFTISVVCFAQRDNRMKERGETSMIRPAPKLITLVLVAVFFAACGIIKTQQVTRGHDILAGSVAQIKKRVTTEKELIHLFGPPTKWRETPDGKEFFYEYSKAGGPQWNLLISVGGGTSTKTLIVWLDKNDVVTDYAYKTS